MSPIAKPELKKKSSYLVKIIAAGKEKGFITHKQVHDILPEEVVSLKEIDHLLLALGENDIEVVNRVEKTAVDPEDSQETNSDTPAVLAKNEDEDEEPVESFVESGAESRMGDPVKLYLHQMGRVPLLSRAEEISISKRIEAGEFMVGKEVLGSALGFQQLHELFLSILKKKKTLQETIDLNPYADSPEGVPRKRSWIRSFGTIKSLRSWSARSRPSSIKSASDPQVPRKRS